MNQKKFEKAEKLYDGITDIRDDLVVQARRKKKRFWKKWGAAAAAVLAAAVAAGILLNPHLHTETGSDKVYALARAEYPKMHACPDEAEYMKANGELDDAFFEVYDQWWDDVRQRRELTGFEASLSGFSEKSIRQFLSGAQGENRVYSPVNVYMALGMLAELTDGDSRGQILDLLCTSDMDALRKQASDIWNSAYRDDGIVKSVLASSVWLNQNVSFKQPALDALAQTYYASAFRGEMGSKEMDAALCSWLNEQTGGLLEDMAGGETLEPETLLALASTVYFSARWRQEFSDSNTKEGIFHADSGDEACEFLNKKESSTDYFWGEHFAAVSQSLDQSGSMWFLLPDEGVSPEELLDDGQAVEFLSCMDPWSWENQKQMLVNLSVPKFDVSSRFDLGAGLKELGVTDIFDGEISDFSPMTDDADSIFLSKAGHAARTVIDEEGVLAAAYTVMAADGGGGLPEEVIDFVLDRPFLFAVASDRGLPLFVGIVNHP